MQGSYHGFELSFEKLNLLLFCFQRSRQTAVLKLEAREFHVMSAEVLRIGQLNFKVLNTLLGANLSTSQ